MPIQTPEIAVVRHWILAWGSLAGRHARQTFVEASAVTLAEVRERGDTVVAAEWRKKKLFPCSHTAQRGDLSAECGQERDS